ncbi:MAG: Dehydrogenase (flavoprotein) [Verrucomicrobia bacterium]|nr:MAG: Dehydrogenase (flavoprotein) [Verrucomicrobiota bacterium]
MKIFTKTTLLVALFNAIVGVLFGAEAQQADVVVVAATPSGVAAAVAAARSGANVILLEEKNHVGGVVAAGLTNTDIYKKAAVGGLFAEFVKRVREHYVQTYGENSEQVKVCQGGHMFEAKVAEQIFRDLLAGEKNIRLIEKKRVISARVVGTDGIERQAERGPRINGSQPKDFGPAVKLVSITAEDQADPRIKMEIRAKTFVDATYEGDLAAMAGVPYRVGRESRETYSEAHAGKIYLRFKDTNPGPGSTGEADDGIQAFCFRMHVTKDQSNAVPIEKPAAFNRDDYRMMLDDMRSGKVTKLSKLLHAFPMPNGKFELNNAHPAGDTGVPSESFDLAEENWTWPEADFAERARILQRYWAHSEGYLWLLQNDPEVPPSIRDEARQFGFPKDEFTDNRHRPHHIYVREGRRIWGEYNFTERDAALDNATGLPRRKPDGVAVAEFGFDSHSVHKYDPAHPGVREGYIFIEHQPLQLPYRILVPKRVDGLLVPVACSASHVGYQTIRMEPVFMALGEACGIAAKTALDARAEVRSVDVPAVQREILKRGGVILYESTPIKPEGL